MIHGTDTSVVASKQDIRLTVQLPKGLLNVDKFDQLLEKYSADIAGAARDFWIAEAGRRLKSSKRQYQDAIVLESASGGGFTLALTDPLAVAVEFGASGFDLKPGRLGKVVPMNLDKLEVPTIESATPRLVTSRGKWKHPGWTGKNIIEDVITEVTDKIIPEYIQKIVEELVAQ
jgi:hypothetical protein